MKSGDERFMREAIVEARLAVGRTHPNPAVGAVIVKQGKIIARGHTVGRPGTPHAEAVALAEAGKRARGADLYTTLEPCDHFGRTPPCSLAILEAGVRRVFSGATDPNPLVRGRGLARLRRGGVEVIAHVLREETAALNLPFFKFIETGLPYVTLKAAVTLDGKLADATGSSKWISSQASRERVHALRDRVDAILVGRNTVSKDDPQLTTRLPGGGGHHPLRVVLDAGLKTPVSAKVFAQQRRARTVVAFGEGAPRRQVTALERQGVTLWQLPSKRGRLRLRGLLERLAQEGHLHVLVEGGSEVFAQLLQEGLADELWLFVAPKILGAEGKSWVAGLGARAMSEALAAPLLEVERVGPDVLLRAKLG